jgi:hypothetical protein
MKFHLILIFCFSFVDLSFTQIQTIPNDSTQILNLMNSFAEKELRGQLGKEWFQENLTENYIFLGGEIDNTNFHIVDYYSTQIIKIQNNSAEVYIILNRLAEINVRDISIKNDNPKLNFLLKKIDNKWKIDGLRNYAFFRLFDSDEFRYIYIIFDSYFPNEETKDTYNFPLLTSLYNNLSIFYRTRFQFSSKYLSKLSPTELQITRNEIFAHYGRPFTTEWLKKYFNEKPWYKENPNYSDQLLTENDKKNMEIILKVEKEKQVP